jgi:murein DD-endopeptidase MepM/ murein hydrolase activator NlpD
MDARARSRRGVKRGLAAAAVLLSACVGVSVRKPAPMGSTPSSAVEFRLPLARARVLSPYGPRGRKFHQGVDLLQTRGGGDPIYAAADGRVAEAGVERGYGRMVLLEHANGWFTRYGHMRSIGVKKGQWVEKGRQIGIVGGTGHATTPHLHFEILTPQRRTVNPAPYVFKK